MKLDTAFAVGFVIGMVIAVHAHAALVYDDNLSKDTPDTVRGGIYCAVDPQGAVSESCKKALEEACPNGVKLLGTYPTKREPDQQPVVALDILCHRADTGI